MKGSSCSEAVGQVNGSSNSEAVGHIEGPFASALAFVFPEKLGDPFGWLVFASLSLAVMLAIPLAVNIFMAWRERRKKKERRDG